MIEELSLYSPEDLAALDALMHELSATSSCSEALLKAALADANVHIYVIRADGHIVATGTLCIKHTLEFPIADIESVVVSRDNKLVALVYIDTEAIAKEQPEKIAAEIMEQNRLAVNKIMPGYCGISAFEIVKEEFEKTPKRSIKRFLYK